MRRNVTVTLDEQTARWVRVEAARRDTSVSGLVAELLRSRMKDATSYEQAMNDFLARGNHNLRRSPADPYPSRDELHQR